MPPADEYQLVYADTPEGFKRCLAVRKAVFVEEQGYAEDIEVDEKDAHCDHLLLVSKSTETDVGVLRLFPPTLKLGRFAIIKAHRGTGAGKRLMELTEDFVRSGQGKSGALLKESGEWKTGKARIQCSSQKEARKFYERCGWTADGSEYLEEGQPHIHMSKELVLHGDAPVTAPASRQYSVVLAETEADRERCFQMRREVFCDEQGFPVENELDEKEDSSDHLMLVDTSTTTPTPVGTIRYHPPSGKLGRLVVLKPYRGGGTGGLLVRAFEDHVINRRGKGGEWAKSQNLKSVRILCSSQHQVEAFYARLGYVREGGEYDDDGWPHVAMYKTLQLADVE